MDTNTRSYIKDKLKAHRMKLVLLSILMLIFLVPMVSSVTADQENKQPPASFSGLVKKASPSVVYISTETKARRSDMLPFDQNDPAREFFERFFGNRMPRNLPPQRGLGTGFIIDNDGYILTNNHVVENADIIKVKLEDEKDEFEAKIIGRDPETDLALIKIDDAKNLTPLKLGDSEKLEVGDWVVAIGNPFGLGHTVTAGIVSAKYRDINAGPFDNFIQTDASINPGNSGGPLMNTKGEVIGINSAIFSQTGQNIGIGFAIPINMAKDLLPMLKEGKVTRGHLGVIVQNIDADLKDKFRLDSEDGALISSVIPGEPSDKAGLKHGDVIVKFEGKKVRDKSDLISMVSSTPVGTEVKVEVIRRGKRKTFSVKLGERPGVGERTVIAEATRIDLGLELEELTPEIAGRLGISKTEGLIVSRVRYGSPAAEAELMPRDIILEVDQEKVETVDDFDMRIQNYKPGEKILLLILRGNAQVYRTLKIRED